LALLAMTPADVLDYVSDADPSKKKVKKEIKGAAGEPAVTKDVTEIGPGATVFKLKGLDVFLMGWIYDNASTLSQSNASEVGIHTRINQTNIEAVRHGLAGFTNLTDAKGGQVPFKTQKAVVNGREYEVVADETLNVLGIRVIGELAREIKKISEVSGQEAKNSAGA
jgi:hypothetical protein